MNFLFFFFGGVLVSFVISGVLLRFSRSLGIRNLNDVSIRWSNQSKPSLGGIGFYFAFLFALLGYAVVFSSGDIFENSEIVGLLSAGTLSFLIGIADDAYDTRPLLKLLGQISCGVLLVIGGTTISLFHSEWPDAIVTIVWVVVIMNSLNMLDNMDGITATVACFVLLSCLVGYWFLEGFTPSPLVFILLTALGALIGFLFYNVHPSKMFMGDTGSQFISLVVSFFAIKYLWNLPSYSELPSWSGLFIALAAFTPAAADTLSVIINRTRRGQSPMVGGKDHTTHHLVYMGLSDFKVWLVFVLLSLLSFILAIWVILNLHENRYHMSLLAIPFFFGVFGWLFRVTLKYPQK